MGAETVDAVTWAYGIVVVVTAIVCFSVRHHLLRGPHRPDATALDGEQIAYLTGGPKRFAAAALARRRLSGESETGESDLRVEAAEVRRTLLDDGWLVPRRREAAVFFCGMALGYVAGGGFIAIVLLVEEGESVWRLVVLTLATLVLAFLAGSRGSTYRSVRRELRRLRGTVPHLRPEVRPALVTYGPAAGALAVGLFGAAAMASVDPEFATVAAGADIDEPDEGTGTGAGCGGCGCGGCGG